MECSTASSRQTFRYLWEQPSPWLLSRCWLRFSRRGGRRESIRWWRSGTSNCSILLEDSHFLAHARMRDPNARTTRTSPTHGRRRRPKSKAGGLPEGGSRIFPDRYYPPSPVDGRREGSIEIA